MANQLKMAIVQAIEQLRALRWSRRRIARELGIDRGTVSRYVRSLEAAPKPAIPPAGSGGSNAATLSGPPARTLGTPSDDGSAADEGPSNAAILPSGSPGVEKVPQPATVPSGWPSSPRRGGATSAGRTSQCGVYGELILTKLQAGLSAQRIWQDLVAEQGFAGGYDSVKRYVRRLGRSPALPFRRLECAAGEEAQVDFGTGAPIVGSDGRRRKTYVFRIVLSHSRKGYSEATYTQSTADFLCALENAFAYFQGVPTTLVVDNLKAAVAHPDWFDPELTPKVQSFCRHYGTVILPTRPYMPRHKGKVEAGVKYVKNNALKGRVFESLEAENRFLADWEANVADKRIHGTTKQQVEKVFVQVERGALRPLSSERFPSFQEAQRKVNRDGHVEVARAYYSVPTAYLARIVWARWDSRLVRIFNHRWEQVAIHVRHERGRFSTQAQHVAPEKINGIERGATHLLGKVSDIGPQAHQWAEAMLVARGIEGVRVLQGLLALARKQPTEGLEKACQIALSHSAFRLRTVRKLIDRQAAEQQPLPFLHEHPIIRPLEDYGAIVARAIHRQSDRPSLGEGFMRHDRTKASSTAAHEKSLVTPSPASQGPADMLPPWPGYPSPGCSSAEPGSVSPDTSSVVDPPSFHQES
jgi:transposase